MIPILEVSQRLLSQTFPDGYSSSERTAKHPTELSQSGSTSKQTTPVAFDHPWNGLENALPGEASIHVRPVVLDDFIDALQVLQGREKLEMDRV